MTAAEKGLLCKFQRNELVILGTQTDFFGMLEAARPVGDRCYVVEMIVLFGFVRIFLDVLIEDAARNDRGLVHEVGTGTVECYRVKGGGDADVRDERDVVFKMAVAVRRNVGDDGDMEARAAIDDRQGILSHLLVEVVEGGVVVRADGIEGADADAAAAADAFVVSAM